MHFLWEEFTILTSRLYTSLESTNTHTHTQPHGMGILHKHISLCLENPFFNMLARVELFFRTRRAGAESKYKFFFLFPSEDEWCLCIDLSFTRSFEVNQRGTRTLKLESQQSGTFRDSFARLMWIFFDTGTQIHKINSLQFRCCATLCHFHFGWWYYDTKLRFWDSHFAICICIKRNWKFQ